MYTILDGMRIVCNDTTHNEAVLWVALGYVAIDQTTCQHLICQITYVEGV